MKLSVQQVQPEALAALAREACRLLVAGEFSALADRFGYAVALGRDPSEAVRQDLTVGLAHLGQGSLDPTAQPVVEVKYFKPNGQLHAVAECELRTVGGGHLLVEVVVSSSGSDFHASLEQISAAA